MGIPLRIVIGCVLGSALCGRSVERTSEVAEARVGHWKRAYVVVSRGPAFDRGGRSYPAHVSHTLALDWDHPHNTAWVQLRNETARTVSSTELDRLADAEYTVRFAPDAHAVAVATDGGHTWKVFDLTILDDPTKQPFWCAHRTFHSLDPWPDSRALAIEILGATDPQSAAFRVHGGDRAGWDDELRGATRYACAHRQDAGLRAAVVESFFRPESDVAYAVTCVGELARQDPALIARLESAQASVQEPRLRTRIGFELRAARAPSGADGRPAAPP